MIKVITGGTGLIGSAFNQGVKLTSKRDLRDYDKAKFAISMYKPDVVVHCAAKVGGVGANMQFPADFFMDNIRMNTNVIQACQELKIPKLVSFLSTCVFPDKVEYPLDETKIELGPPHTSNFAYAYAKRMADVQIRAFNQQYGTQYFSVIPCNVYGPNDNYSLEVGHVIPMLIHKCYLAKKNRKTFEVWGDGTPLREFVYSKDVANIVDLLIQKYTGTEPVIISNPTEYSIKQVVDLIVENMGFKGKVKWLTDKPNGQHRKPSSNAKLLSIIGEYEFTTLEKGLKESIEWFILNYPNVRK
jgi:GDP-L-fucose synthase